jgi:hypothetical protein
MSLVPFIVLVATPEATSIAGRMERTHLAMKTASVFVSDGLTNTIPTKVRIANGLCLLAMPNQQIAEVKPTEIRFYDQIFNQVALLKNAKPAKVPDSAARVAIVQREAIAWLVDEAQKKDFFAEIKKDNRWRVVGRSIVLIDAKRNAHSEIFFDNNYRVTDIKLTIGKKGVSYWKYRYVTDSDIPRIPSNARLVKGLPPRPTIPVKTDGKTVKLAQSIWRSMSRLEGRKITQVADDGIYQLTFGSGKLSESGPKGSWTVSNTTLVIRPKSGQQKTMIGQADKFLDALRAKGIYASPIARYVLNRKIPFLDLFDRTDEVKLVEGIGKIDGKALSVISLKRATIRVRMYVDPKSGDLAMVSSDAQDSRGNSVSGSRLKLTYQ